MKLKIVIKESFTITIQNMTVSILKYTLGRYNFQHKRIVQHSLSKITTMKTYSSKISYNNELSET